MAGLTKAEINEITRRQKEVLFYGTKKNGYADSGLWKFLPLVYTKDAIDLENPIKRLVGPGDIYIIVILLYMLIEESVLFPKSRQVRMSWISCMFALWIAMSGPVREVLYQTKKEDDAFDQTTMGKDAPGEGRIDFILQHLPTWLRDPHIVSGKGNSKGSLRFSPYPKSPEGVPVLWSGSKISAIPQGAHQVRHFTPTMYFNDESAFQAEYRASMIAASACARKIISVSSVDSGSFFNEAVLNAEDTETNVIHPLVKLGLEKMGIEWPPGLKSYKTRSGTWVLEVHYSADPKKDPAREGAEWYANAVLKDGYEGDYESDGWQTEMEINYGRGGGQRVFPKVVVDSPIYVDSYKPSSIMNKMRFFAGYDYGSMNPSAFEVIGVDSKAKMHSVWELYEPCTNVGNHVAAIKACPYWDRIEYTVCDQSIMSKTQQGASDIKTLAEVFEEHGLSMIRGRRGQDVTVSQILKADFWNNLDDPRYLITKSCPALWQEILGLRMEKHISEAVSARKNAPEKIRDKNNHGFDAIAVLIDYGVQPFIAEIVQPTAGTFAQAVTDLRINTARENRRDIGIHVT